MTIDYAMIGSNDLDRSRAFYDAVLPLFGGRVDVDYPGFATCYGLPGGMRVWLARPHDGKAAIPGNGSMLGFGCASSAEVDAAHAAALANGGSSEGDPGPRPNYGPEFYGGYVRDPDGNKMSFIVAAAATAA